MHSITAAYDEAVHWKRNIFSVPSGNAGKSFVSELACLFRAYAEGSALEVIALKAITVMSLLLLQKPHRTSKSRDHMACLERRMKSWKAGDNNELMLEGRTIQQRLSKYGPSHKDDQHLA